jgi:tRNA A-37 threonylcarbamoyl transferase component Bud32
MDKPYGQISTGQILYAAPDSIRSLGMVVIGNEYKDITGLLFRYECIGSEFRVRMLKEPPAGFDQGDTLPAKYIEKWASISVSWNDEEMATDEEFEAAGKEIDTFVEKLAVPMILELAPPATDRGGNDFVPANLQEYLYPDVFNLQIVSKDGEVQIIRSDDFPPYNPHPPVPFIAGAREDVSSFSPSEIQVLERYRPWAVKVSVDDQIFCCKVSIDFRGAFLREYEILQKILDADAQNAINATRLRGVIMVEEGVVGVLMDFIQTNQPDLTYDLTAGKSLTLAQRARWAAQIEKTVQQLHDIDVVWGDAKTANILIDTHSNAWITDFGGGITIGWTDLELEETKEGDLEALEKILEDVRGQSSREVIEQGRINRAGVGNIGSDLNGVACCGTGCGHD